MLAMTDDPMISGEDHIHHLTHVLVVHDNGLIGITIILELTILESVEMEISDNMPVCCVHHKQSFTKMS